MRDIASVLNPADISDAVLYLLHTPYHVNVSNMTVRPVCDEFWMKFWAEINKICFKSL